MKQIAQYIKTLVNDFENRHYSNAFIKIIVPILITLIAFSLLAFGINIFLFGIKTLIPYIELIAPYFFITAIFIYLLKLKKSPEPKPVDNVTIPASDSKSTYNDIQFYLFKILKKTENELQIRTLSNPDEITDPLNYLIKDDKTTIYRFIVAKASKTLHNESMVAKLLNRKMEYELSCYEPNYLSNPYFLTVHNISYPKYFLANVTDNGDELVLDYIELTESYINGHQEKLNISTNNTDNLF